MTEELVSYGKNVSRSGQNKLVDEVSIDLDEGKGTSVDVLECGLTILASSWRSGVMLLAILVTVRASSDLSSPFSSI